MVAKNRVVTISYFHSTLILYKTIHDTNIYWKKVVISHWVLEAPNVLNIVHSIAVYVSMLGSIQVQDTPAWFLLPQLTR